MYCYAEEKKSNISMASSIRQHLSQFVIFQFTATSRESIVLNHYQNYVKKVCKK